MNSETRIASLDISNMYTNIPIHETKIILNSTLDLNMTDDDTELELLDLCDIMTK
jgi:hypothetical protein